MGTKPNHTHHNTVKGFTKERHKNCSLMDFKLRNAIVRLPFLLNPRCQNYKLLNIKEGCNSGFQSRSNICGQLMKNTNVKELHPYTYLLANPSSMDIPTRGKIFLLNQSKCCVSPLSISIFYGTSFFERVQPQAFEDADRFLQGELVISRQNA